MTRVSHGIDRVAVSFDDESLVASGGLFLVATLVASLGLEALIDTTVRLTGRVGGALPGRKVLTLVHAIVAGASHVTTPTSCVRAQSTECSGIGSSRLHPLDNGDVPSGVQFRPCPANSTGSSVSLWNGRGHQARGLRWGRGR